tara:strand:+ start:88 stop:420 length:333 start_codon:yes stop_codon:yes gene_type:complete
MIEPTHKTLHPRWKLLPPCVCDLLGITELAARATQLQARLEHECDAWRRSDRSGDALARVYECKVCFDARIEAVFLPCGHALACEKCARKCERCPVCRLKAEAITTIRYL